MQRNIDAAVALYSGNKPFGLFAQKIHENIAKINEIFGNIAAVFESQGVDDFGRLPKADEAKRMFAKDFIQLNRYLEMARLQGFSWENLEFDVVLPDGETVHVVCNLDEQTHLILAQRYKELFSGVLPGLPPEPLPETPPYDLDAHLIEIDTGRIDTDYMNSNFVKWRKALGGPGEAAAAEELHRSFAALSQEDQKFAELILHDVERGAIEIDETFDLRELLTRYACAAKNDQIDKLVNTFGLDATLLREMLALSLSEQNINEFGRFDQLKDTIDKARAKAYFESVEGGQLPMFKVNIKAADLLRKFILSGGFDL
jgi:type I restriction enzyme R subunit